jgi:hypothetical protein
LIFETLGSRIPLIKGIFMDLDQKSNSAILKKSKLIGNKVNVQISDNSGNSSQGEVYIKIWTQAERTQRALKWGAITWLAALFCVLIPILHFILVPFFLILGPILSVKIYKQESVVQGGQGSCPRCHKNLKIEKAKAVWPISDLCTECQNAVKIEIK